MYKCGVMAHNCASGWNYTTSEVTNWANVFIPLITLVLLINIVMLGQIIFYSQLLFLLVFSISFHCKVLFA